MVICEVNTDKYLVRVHSGKLTELERKEVITQAAEKFNRDIQKSEAKRGKRNDGP